MSDEQRIDRIMNILTWVWKQNSQTSLCHILQNLLDYSRQTGENIEAITDSELEGFLSLYRQKGWTGINLAIINANKAKETSASTSSTEGYSFATPSLAVQGADTFIEVQGEDEYIDIDAPLDLEF